MKRIALLLLYVMLAVVTYGQSSYDQSKEVFALLKVFVGIESTATIDFGDGTPRMVFVDDKGKTRKFRTNFEPVNLLIKNGWSIEQLSSYIAYQNTITLWVMKKKVNRDSEIKEGMKIKETN